MKFFLSRGCSQSVPVFKFLNHLITTSGRWGSPVRIFRNNANKNDYFNGSIIFEEEAIFSGQFLLRFFYHYNVWSKQKIKCFRTVLNLLFRLLLLSRELKLITRINQSLTSLPIFIFSYRGYTYRKYCNSITFFFIP